MNTNIRNQVHLIGHTGQDVELITFDSGTKKATVSLATSAYYKNTKGEVVSNTQWHNLVAWGKGAELLAKAVQKGDQIIVDGAINYRTYEDNSGITRNVTEIIVTNFIKAVSSKKEEEAPSGKKASKVEATPF